MLIVWLKIYLMQAYINFIGEAEFPLETVSLTKKLTFEKEGLITLKAGSSREHRTKPIRQRRF